MRSPLHGRGAHRDRDRGRPNGRCRDESGSILVLFSIFLTLFLLCCAIVIDVGYWWVAGKRAQIAADACALAAARELPKNWTPPRTECLIAGHDYALENLPDQSGVDPEPRHLSTTVLSPYEADSSMVEATVEMRVQTFFGRIVGLEWIDLTRRAVAEREEGEGNYAIYSHDFDGCADGEGLEFDGDNISINGLVHSNGWYNVNSAHPPDEFWAADGTINKAVCTAKLQPYPDGAVYGDGPNFLPNDTTFQPWPTWFTPADFGWPSCTYNGEKIVIKEDRVEITNPNQIILFTQPRTIPTGTYCATNEFLLNGSGTCFSDATPDLPIKGTISALGRLVKVDGSCLDLEPHQNNVLLFSIANNDTNPNNDGSLAAGGNPTCQSPPLEMQLDNGPQTWKGVIFNPCGRINVNIKGGLVGNTALTGTIIGYKVKVNSDEFDMIGKSNFGADTVIALVE